MTKRKSNIPLGMVDVLYSRRYQTQQNSSYFLTELKRFGELSPQEMAVQMGITPRAKESKLPTVLLGNITYIYLKTYFLNYILQNIYQKITFRKTITFIFT